ncbi:MAG: hypothetical protein WCK35_10230 [Chloroflexota bacterium]
MIGKKLLTISDIQTDEILYYDPDLEKQCYTFCLDRDIECLPALDNPQMIFLRNDEKQGFSKESVSETRSVNGDINIFASGMLEKFAARPLLMVYQGSELTGVVHYSDYNKPNVSLYLYELFFNYEKALRNTLIQHGFDNASMIAYFEEKKLRGKDQKTIDYYASKVTDYQDRGSKKKLPAFEVFYLKELVALTNNKKIFKPSLNDTVTSLRNMVMHVNQFVEMKDLATDNLIYDFAVFQKFFGMALQLHTDFKRVNNHLALNR